MKLLLPLSVVNHGKAFPESRYWRNTYTSLPNSLFSQVFSFSNIARRSGLDVHNLNFLQGHVFFLHHPAAERQQHLLNPSSSFLNPSSNHPQPTQPKAQNMGLSQDGTSRTWTCCMCSKKNRSDREDGEKCEGCGHTRGVCCTGCEGSGTKY